MTPVVFRRPRMGWKPVVSGIAALLLIGAGLLLPAIRLKSNLREGRRHLLQREDDLALQSLEEALRLAPDSAEVHFLLARAHRRLGRLDVVRRHIARAAELSYDRERLRREEWLAMAQAGQWSEAEPQLARLLKDPRGDAPAICEAYVDGYFAAYRFDRAFPLLKAWEADFPNDSQPHVFYALFHEHTSRWPDAARSYRRALELAPTRMDVRLRLASLLVRIHEYGEAGEQYRICLVRKPNDPGILCGWGRCLLGNGHVDEARATFQRVLQLQPDHYDGRLGMGQIESGAGRHKQALVWLAPLCRERPTDMEARYLLAKSLQADGQTDAAKEHFQFVVEAQRELAVVQKLAEQVRDRPEDAALRYEIGSRLLKYDDPVHGVAWLQSALEIDADHGPTHAALADHYARSNNVELAEKHRRRALALLPGSAPATAP